MLAFNNSLLYIYFVSLSVSVLYLIIKRLKKKNILEKKFLIGLVW